MEKKQILEIICVIAGISLAIKAVDYLQFLITGFFQLMQNQGYTEFYYFFIYLTTIIIYIAASALLIGRARYIAREIDRRLEPTDILLDLNSSAILEYALIIVGAITLISGLSSFLTNLIRSITMVGELIVSGNMNWLNGLIKIIIGGLVIYKAKALSGLLKRKPRT